MYEIPFSVFGISYMFRLHEPSSSFII